jgi:Fe2+ transport system protein B
MCEFELYGNTLPNSPWEDNRYLFESEDEYMDNLAAEMIDEQFEEGFKIDNDNLAEWAICKISEDKAEFQRLINVCETKVLEYQEKIRKYREQLERKTSGLKGALMQYFETVPHKTTKTQETYKLPSGTLKLKYGTPEFIKDEKKLAEWLKSNGLKDYYEEKTVPKWGEFKKDPDVVISDGKVLFAGEIVDGVTAQDRPDSFEVEI